MATSVATPPARPRQPPASATRASVSPWPQKRFGAPILWTTSSGDSHQKLVLRVCAVHPDDVGAGLGRHGPHAYAEEGAAEGDRHGRRRGEWVHRFEFSELHKPKAIRCADEPAQKLNSGLRSVSHRGKDDDKAVVYAVRHRPALRWAIWKVSSHPSVFPHPSVS